MEWHGPLGTEGALGRAECGSRPFCRILSRLSLFTTVEPPLLRTTKSEPDWPSDGAASEEHSRPWVTPRWRSLRHLPGGCGISALFRCRTDLIVSISRPDALTDRTNCERCSCTAEPSTKAEPERSDGARDQIRRQEQTNLVQGIHAARGGGPHEFAVNAAD